MAVAEDQNVTPTVVHYLKEPLDRAALQRVVAILEDPVEDLVRKDSHFKKLELNADDFVGNSSAVVDILVEHPKLMQRPLVVSGDKAIIGRPKDRVADFLAS